MRSTEQKQTLIPDKTIDEDKESKESDEKQELNEFV
jgi:hypothetical protein